MSKTYSITLRMVVLLLLGWPIGMAFSETATSVTSREIRFEDLTAAAQQANPDILAAKAEWLAARKQIWTESSLPDPMGEYDIMGSDVETRVGPREQRFMISQEIPFPLKLVERGRAAAAAARAMEARYHAVERDVLLELHYLYAELYYLDAARHVLDDIKEVLKKAESTAQARYSNLSGAQRDVAKAQAEVSMSLEKIFMLEQQRRSTVAKMNSLLDRDPFDEIGSVLKPEKPSVTMNVMEAVNLAVQNRPEILEMEEMAQKNRRKKRLAQLDFIPDLNVGFEYVQVGGGTSTHPEDGKDSWMIPLRINLPIWWNKNVPAVQAAQKIVEAAEARVRAAKNTAYFEVKDAFYRFESASKIADLYETAIIPQAQIALSADQAGYESGKADFLELLDSERVYLNAQLSYLRIFTETIKSHADLTRAAGLDLEKKEERS